jgi:predicted DNA-binding transcriptional regulator AlpA
MTRDSIDLRAGVPARHLSMGTSTAVEASPSRSFVAQGAERFVSRAEMAAIMGVSLATIDRMVAEGMPSVTWGRRTRRFRSSVAIDWAAERGRAA